MRRRTVDTVRMAAGASLALPGMLSLHRRRQGGPPRRIVLFYYHRVFAEDRQPVYQLGIHRDLFRSQLRDLKRSFRFVPLLDALEASRSPAPGGDLACLTFDDGYEDNYLHALPVLRELEIPATIFLVTGLIGSGELLWFDSLKRLVEAAPGTTLPLPPGLGGGRLAIGGSAARRRAMSELLDRLKGCEDGRLRELLHQLWNRVPAGLDPEDTRDRLLTWEQAREMEGQGISFGSHTVTHPLLPRIEDPAALRRELCESREMLGAHLRAPLPVLAYPGGAWSEAALRAARDAGYRWGLANVPGWLGPSTDPFLVPRRALGPRSSLYLGRRHSRAILRAESEGLFDRARKKTRAAAAGVVASAFDEKADAYLRARRDDPAFAGEEAKILGMLRHPPGRAIEIGSGAGITATRLAELGWKVVATDISLQMLLRAHSLQREMGLKGILGLVRCDVQRLPFRDGCADTVLSHGVLEYVPDVPRALADMARVLRPGGSLVATIPNRLSPASWASTLLGRLATLRSRLLGRTLRRVPARHRFPWHLDALAREAGLARAEGVVQTFAFLPAYLFPRGWLRLNNRLVGALPKSAFFRWWGTQYIARYERRG